MKIRLIEPISPSRHLWSKSYFVRLGLPMIGAALVEAGHDVRIFNPQLAPIDWADVYSSDLVGLSSTTSTIVEAYRIGDDLRRRGIPVIIGGSHVTFMADEALEHADYVARGEAGEIIMVELAESLAGDRELGSITGISYSGRGRQGRARAPARALRGPRHAAVPGPHARGRLGADHQHADHDQLGLPLRLHLLLGDGDVRQEVPLPQRRERRRRDQGEEPGEDLLLRRQHGRQQEAPQAAAAAHDRRGRRRAVGRPGAHRRRARPGADGAHAGLEVRLRRPRPRVGQPGHARRLREVADRGRHRARHQGAPRLRHPRPRHVRAGRRPRHAGLRGATPSSSRRRTRSTR